MSLAPAITRVHKLFRLRTVVNDCKKPLSSHDIAKILVNRKLSRKSTILDMNHERRARDHSMNCVLLGLLMRNSIKTVNYEKTPIGKLLSDYSFSDPFPKDIRECAIFMDRLCRLKLANSQLRGKTYSDLRVRPIMNVLKFLAAMPLHISQIHYTLSSNKDFILNPEEMHTMKNRIFNYSIDTPNADTKFIQKYIRESSEMKEISRSTKPLMDWCQQASLVYHDDNLWYRISENGLLALFHYAKFMPIWYSDLSFDPINESSLLVTYNIATLIGKDIKLERLSRYEKSLLKEMGDYIKFKKGMTLLNTTLDFDPYYDVPFSDREQVLATILKLFKNQGIKDIDISFPIMTSISELQSTLVTSSSEKDFREHEKTLGIKLPRRESFQTEFEWQSCIRLIHLGYNAGPYSGEFEGACDLRIATDNPDAVIKNSLLCLVECKSKKEWKNKIKLDKRVKGEFLDYEEYGKEVGADSVLFICDAEEMDEERYMKKFYKDSKLKLLVIVNSNAIQQAIRNTKLKNKIDHAIKKPTKFPLKDRIFVITGQTEKGQ